MTDVGICLGFGIEKTLPMVGRLFAVEDLRAAKGFVTRSAVLVKNKNSFIIPNIMYKNRVVVYTSGTFDMFHSNHLKMIEYARGLGDTLIVGVSTDELVCSYKRPPIIPFEERQAIIKALKYPDIVIPQRSLDHTELVKKLNIDVFVVGDDWTGKYDYLKELGVSVFYFPYGDGVSTTKIKQEIVEKYENIKSQIDHQPNPDVV